MPSGVYERTAAHVEHFARGDVVAARLRHGHARTKTGKPSPTWNSWRMMLRRCFDPGQSNFARYGGRGIKVCERWLRFENFLADMGIRPQGKTLDRMNVNGDYEVSNCRWATPKEQRANQSLPS